MAQSISSTGDIGHTAAYEAHPAHDAHGHDDHQHKITFAQRWLFSTNHKDIGTLYIIFAIQAGIVGFGGLQVISARQAPDLIGVYEIQVSIPGNAPTGNSIPLSVGVVAAGANTAVTGTTVLIPIH